MTMHFPYQQVHPEPEVTCCWLLRPWVALGGFLFVLGVMVVVIQPRLVAPALPPDQLALWPWYRTSPDFSVDAFAMDERLLGGIQKALRHKVKVTEVEGVVGMKAEWHSRRRYQRQQFLRHHLEPDFDSGIPLPRLQEFTDIVVWARPIPNEAKLVGIGWKQDGSLIAFYAGLVL
jgi:hypothetical protein